MCEYAKDTTKPRNLEELEQIHIISYGLNVLLNEAMNKLGAIYAFGNSYPRRVRMDVKIDWYSMAYSALLESLVNSVSSLIDRAKYGDSANCSFKELQQVLAADKKQPEQCGRIIRKIDALLEEHKDSILECRSNFRILKYPLNMRD